MNLYPRYQQPLSGMRSGGGRHKAAGGGTFWNDERVKYTTPPAPLGAVC